MATLTRAEMEAVIKSGGSVLYQGRTLSRPEHLPSAAELAQGDPAKEAEASADLQAQIADLQAQLAQLGQLQPSTPSAPSKTTKKKTAATDEGGESSDDPPSS